MGNFRGSNFFWRGGDLVDSQRKHLAKELGGRNPDRRRYGDRDGGSHWKRQYEEKC